MISTSISPSCTVSQGGSRRSSAHSWRGLGGVLPLDLLRVFDKNELELLIGGMTEIDKDD